jgi:hypothetical protein
MQAAEPQLVLDRGVTLVITAIAGIKSDTGQGSLLLRFGLILSQSDRIVISYLV